MNLTARSVLSCRLFPNRMGVKFQTVDARQPVIYPYAGLDLRLCFFNTDEELYIPSNIATLYVTIKETAASGSALITTSIAGTALNPACSLADWNAGTAAHAIVPITGAMTANLNGKTSAFLSVWGITQDDLVDQDVFGIADVQVINAGLAAVTPEAPPGETYITATMLAGLLGNYVRAGMNPPGAWFGLVSPNNGHSVTYRMNDDGTPGMDIN